jgi:hypothetical protein
MRESYVRTFVIGGATRPTQSADAIAAVSVARRNVMATPLVHRTTSDRIDSVVIRYRTVAWCGQGYSTSAIGGATLTVLIERSIVLVA